MKITELNDILIQRATLFIILTFVKVEKISAQREQFRVFRIESNPQLQRPEPFYFRPSGQKNTLHFNGGSFRVEGAVPREISQGQSDPGRSFQSNRANELQGFDRQVSIPIDPWGQIVADVLPDHMRQNVRLEKIAQPDNSPSAVLPDHLRSTSNKENKQSSQIKENHRQTGQHNVDNQNMPSKNAHNPKEPMNANIGIFDVLIDPQQSRLNGVTQSPYDTFQPTPTPAAFNPEGYVPVLFPFSGDREFDPRDFLMQSDPLFIDVGMGNPQQNNQQSQTQSGNKQGIVANKNQKTQYIDSQLNNQQDQSKSTALLVNAMLQNTRFMDAMEEIQHISRLSKPILRQSNQNQFVTETPLYNNARLQESQVKDSKSLFPQTQTEKQPKEIRNKKLNNAKPEKKVIQLNKSPKHVAESIRNQVMNFGDPRAPKVVEIQIESERPELTKSLLMNLLSDPNVQFSNGQSQNNIESNGNKNSATTSLLSLLSGQQQPHLQFSAGIPSSYYTQEIITQQVTKPIFKPRFRAGVPISHFPDKQFIKSVKQNSQLFEKNVKALIPKSLKPKFQYSPKQSEPTQKIDKMKAARSDMRIIPTKQIVNQIENHKQRKHKDQIELPNIFVPTMNGNNQEVYVSAIPSFSIYQGKRKLPVRKMQNVPLNHNFVVKGNERQNAYVQPPGLKTISPVKTVKEQFDSGVPKSVPVRKIQNDPVNHKFIVKGNERQNAYVQPPGLKTISPVKTVKEQFDSGVPNILPVRKIQNDQINHKFDVKGNERENAYLQPSGLKTISPVTTVKEPFDTGVSKINQRAESEASVNMPLNKAQPEDHVPLFNENIGQNIKSKVEKTKKNKVSQEASSKTITPASEVVSAIRKDKSSNAEISNKELVSSSIITTDAKKDIKLRENVKNEKKEKTKELSNKKEDSKSKKKSKSRKSKKSKKSKSKKKSRKSKKKSKKSSAKSKQGTNKV
ncbi:ankyrin repeat domain-containing protein 12-like [Mytilus edulis]|uniref:ankyrin repeat domain-containing protein 12-like n=1 Tax=Mytilus edulis TaxID=6550 RepID=UPI0039EE6C4A